MAILQLHHLLRLSIITTHPPLPRSLKKQKMAAQVLPNHIRYAVVTGANKGIGFEICRQLASKGITVILTSRNRERGLQAQERLKMETGLTDNIVFHQLDVCDSATVDALVEFIKTNYGRLDILVNNAGISGIDVEGDSLILEQQIEEDATSIFSTNQDGVEINNLVSFYTVQEKQVKANGKITQTLEGAKECIQTNFYGAKRVTEALIPLLKLSDSPRIVNVSSLLGNLKLLCNDWAKQVLSNVEHMTDEKVDQVVEEFLSKFKEGSLKQNQWPTEFSAYKVSKEALNAHTRMMANKYPDFRINCLCPGFARTDITCNLGPLSAAEAAVGPVALALVADGGPSGFFFCKNKEFPF